MSLLQPKRRKFRKKMISPISGKAGRGWYVAYGEYGLKAIESAYISNRQLEAARKVIIRRIKKIGKMRMRVFPDTPITKGGLEMPMGKGKGEVDKFCATVKRGKILFEIGGVPEELAIEALSMSIAKLPIKCRVVKKGEIR